MGAYIDGARENLDLMDKRLLELEQNPSNIEAVGEIFRAAHTLKGMSATMGFEKIAHLTHEMENLLDKLRNNQLTVTPPVIDLIFETFDILRTLVDDSINQTDSTLDLTEISGKLAAMANGTAPVQVTSPTSKSGSATSGNNDISDFALSDLEISGLHEAKDSGKHVILLTVSLVADCLLKGPRVFMVMRAIEECEAEIIKSVPDAKDLENERFDKSFKMLLISSQTTNEVKDSIEGISEIESVEAIELDLSNISDSSSVTPTPTQSYQAPSQPTYSRPVPTPPPAPVTPQPSAPPQQPFYQVQPQQQAYQAPTQQQAYQAPIQQQAYSAPPPQVASPQLPKATYDPQSATPVSVPQAPSQPAIAQPTPPPPQASQQQSEENSEEEEKEIIGFIQLITFMLAGETYALEIQQVETIINLTNITRVPKAPSHIDGVINLRGEIIPVINTRRRLKLSEGEKSPLNQIIILTFEEEKVKAGFLVDSVREVIRLPETSIEPPSRVSESVDIEYLRGVGKIDKNIIILLNAHRIVFDTPKED
jgi:chemotaxis signal transduction protein/HPt (histidine-containing phosphotransfer) domain-containing protein